MGGEKKMVYKKITFKAAPFSYELSFDDRITLVGGDSGTGKTVLYEMLEDVRLTEQDAAALNKNAATRRMAITIKAPFQCFDRNSADFLVFSAAFFAEAAVFCAVFPVFPAFAAIYSFLMARFCCHLE